MVECMHIESSVVNETFTRCPSHRRWRMHLMSRHKYLIVIGSVLFVDVLFLFPYSGIQMVAFLHLNNLLTTSHRSTLIRWGLQVSDYMSYLCENVIHAVKFVDLFWVEYFLHHTSQVPFKITEVFEIPKEMIK